MSTVSGDASERSRAASSSDTSAQHIRDIKLAIEFKYMMKHAPGGVFLMPSLDDNRVCHGVIFLRRGLYQNGVFRFKMTLSKMYNSPNTHPHIQFTPPVYNPLVDIETGVLDLRMEDTLREWSPEKHFLLTAMTFLKGIFYMKNFDKFPNVPNGEALACLKTDKEQFIARISKCVQDSLGRLYEPVEPGCLLVFTEPKPAHYNLRLNILNSTGVEDPAMSTPSETKGSETTKSRSGTFYDASNDFEDAAERDSHRQIADIAKEEANQVSVAKALAAELL